MRKAGPGDASSEVHAIRQCRAREHPQADPAGVRSLIAVESLRFRWPASRDGGLDIAHLRVGAGERVFVCGASGSGKSTLLALLGGVLAPERGTIHLLDRDLTAMPANQRDRFRADHVGFVFQQFNLVPYLPVLDNVLLPCRFSGRRRSRAEGAGGSAAGAALQLLAAMGLGRDLAQRTVTALSVGQQQRVAAARALIGMPEVIFADEPTSALDPDAQHLFLDLLLGQCDRSGATLLYVSHDHRLAERFDRRIELAHIDRPPLAEAAE